MNKCALDKKVSHAKAKEQFRNTYYFCNLVEHAGIGMNNTGILCGHCCLRIQSVCECISDLILRNTINKEQLTREPKCFVEYLPEDLKEYVDCMVKITGKEWKAISDICDRCRPIPVKPQVLPKVEATKMETISRSEV